MAVTTYTPFASSATAAPELRALRAATRLTQAKMADRIGIQVATYVAYERGRPQQIPMLVIAAARIVAAAPAGLLPPTPSAAQLVRRWAWRLGVDITDERALCDALGVPSSRLRRWLSSNAITATEAARAEKRVASEEAWLRGFVARHPDAATVAPGLIPDKFLRRATRSGTRA